MYVISKNKTCLVLPYSTVHTEMYFVTNMLIDNDEFYTVA